MMVEVLFKRILLPLIVGFLVVVIAFMLFPAEDSAYRLLPGLLYGTWLLYWWLTGMARYVARRWRWAIVGYIVNHLAIGLLLTGLLFSAGLALTPFYPAIAAVLTLLSMVVGLGWFLWSLAHLARHGRRRKQSLLWRTLSRWLDEATEAKPAPKAAKSQAAKAQPSQAQAAKPTRATPKGAPAPLATKASATPAVTAYDAAPASTKPGSPKPPSSKPARKVTTPPLFTNVGAGGERAPSAGGAAIPPRVSLPTMVNNNATDFLQQAQAWATRQEYVGRYVPFDAYSPTYRQMSFEQQQWYFYWRTQVRQGNFLATDLSYLFVYAYELLNVVGVASPNDARDRLVNFWQSYRKLQPKLDAYLVDWIADFGVLHGLSESALSWYAHALREGATSRNAEPLQLEAWHQQGRDYAAMPASTLYTLANYAAQQNKFYQAFQAELALDDALKRGVAVVDHYVQESQQLSLYELHLPMPTQTVMRPPLQGAPHRYPTVPIAIARVRPWLRETTLQDDLKQILRYTENILRTQASFKTKLRGVTLPPPWAAVLDQAFVKLPPKRVVTIDLAGAAALQRESDELRQRLLSAGATSSVAPEALPDAPRTPEIAAAHLPSPEPVPTLSSDLAPIQRPEDAPAGLLTDLSALLAIMGDARSEATALLHALRGQGWQSPPTQLKVGNQHAFVNVLFDAINERALVELGDALLFVEADEWVVAEDYRDEIAYLLDHPNFAPPQTAALPASGAAVVDEATSPTTMNTTAPSAEISDLIPAGWEECVRHMQPLDWATLAIVLAQDGVMPKLEALARTHFVTANQLLDQVNERGLDAMGDNLIDVATTPPQVIEEYREPLAALLVWAREHHQLEG